MIPNVFVFLTQMPISLNGKIDKHALNILNLDASINYKAPITELEKILCQVWEEVLEHPVGILDNFFDQGGDSILSIKLISQLQQLGFHYTIKDLFDYPTIAEFAQNTHKLPSKAYQSTIILSKLTIDLIPIVIQKRPAPILFLMPPATGNAFCYSIYASINHPDYGRNPNYRRIEDLAAVYLEKIKQIQPKGPYYLGGWSFGGMVAFSMAQLLKTSQEQTDLLFLIDSIFRESFSYTDSQLHQDLQSILENEQDKSVLTNQGLFKDNLNKARTLLEQLKLSRHHGQTILLKAESSDIKSDIISMKKYFSSLTVIESEGTHFELFNKKNQESTLRKTQRILKFLIKQTDRIE